jgi:hypothetical protein
MNNIDVIYYTSAIKSGILQQLLNLVYKLPVDGTEGRNMQE